MKFITIRKKAGDFIKLDTSNGWLYIGHASIVSSASHGHESNHDFCIHTNIPDVSHFSLICSSFIFISFVCLVCLVWFPVRNFSINELWLMCCCHYTLESVKSIHFNPALSLSLSLPNEIQKTVGALWYFSSLPR